MNIKLEISPPLINSYPIYGSLFSIIEDSDVVDNWLCNNFIQLRLLTNVTVFFESYRSILFNCPNMTHSRYCKNMLEADYNRNLPKFIINMLNNNYYIFLNVDRYYIKKYNYYGKNHLFHELFIIGYDDSKQIFYCCDNIDSGKFEEFECTFSELQIAYDNVEDTSFYTDIHCITTDFGSDIPDEINIDQIITLLEAYKNSSITPNFSERHVILEYGFNIHSTILNILIVHIQTQKSVPLELRQLYVFYEHKKLMVYRLNIIKKRYNTNVLDELIDKYSALEKSYLRIKSLIIKYNYSFDTSVSDRLISTFKQSIIDEQLILDDLITALASLK